MCPARRHDRSLLFSLGADVNDRTIGSGKEQNSAQARILEKVRIAL